MLMHCHEMMKGFIADQDKNMACSLTSVAAMTGHVSLYELMKARTHSEVGDLQLRDSRPLQRPAGREAESYVAVQANTTALLLA